MTRRAKKRVALAVLLCTPAAAVLLAAAATTQGPHLFALKANIDFGKTQEGKIVPVSFTIRNTGTETVVISETRQSAGCIAEGPPIKPKIPPGGQAKLNYLFDSTGYGGAGVTRWVKVFYNNKKFSPLKLTVTGTVTPIGKHQAAPGEMMYNFFVLIDVRPVSEFKKAHIIGAINIPAEKLKDRLEEISANARKKTVFYLYSQDGEKSNALAEQLRTKGFKHALSLVGGFAELKKQYDDFIVPHKQ